MFPVLDLLRRWDRPAYVDIFWRELPSVVLPRLRAPFLLLFSISVTCNDVIPAILWRGAHRISGATASMFYGRPKQDKSNRLREVLSAKRYIKLWKQLSAGGATSAHRNQFKGGSLFVVWASFPEYD